MAHLSPLPQAWRSQHDERAQAVIFVQVPDGYPRGRVRPTARMCSCIQARPPQIHPRSSTQEGPEVRVEHLGKGSAVDEFESAVIIGILWAPRVNLPIVTRTPRFARCRSTTPRSCRMYSTPTGDVWFCTRCR
jgi:hypothetical protein